MSTTHALAPDQTWASKVRSQQMSYSPGCKAL